tara:strand:- start:74 stop:199 length:126 start_codon:yes stop_codon:yes gene_type:complete
MKDNLLRIKELGDKDSQALREGYKEWLEVVKEEINTIMFFI